MGENKNLLHAQPAWKRRNSVFRGTTLLGVKLYTHSSASANAYLCNGRTRSELIRRVYAVSPDCSGRSYNLSCLPHLHRTAALCETEIKALFPFIAFEFYDIFIILAQNLFVKNEIVNFL